jgi:hypothetical protein
MRLMLALHIGSAGAVGDVGTVGAVGAHLSLLAPFRDTHEVVFHKDLLAYYILKQALFND